MSHRIRSSALVLALLLACARNRDDDAGRSSAKVPPAPATPVTDGTGGGSSGVGGSGVGATKVRPLNAVVFRGDRGRLAPEQFSALMKSAFAYESKVSIDSYGMQWDRVTERYGVQLGGIDFESASVRDGTPTAQMVLAARAVAIETAISLVNRDRLQLQAKQEPFIFTLCKLNEDRPYVEEDDESKPAKQEIVREGEARWRAQLEDLFWRLLSRAPTESDVAAARQAFVDTWRLEKKNERRGWVMILYGLLSSAELWAL